MKQSYFSHELSVNNSNIVYEDSYYTSRPLLGYIFIIL